MHLGTLVLNLAKSSNCLNVHSVQLKQYSDAMVTTIFRNSSRSAPSDVSKSILIIAVCSRVKPLLPMESCSSPGESLSA